MENNNTPTTLQIRTTGNVKEQFEETMKELESKTKNEALERLIEIFNDEKLKGKLNNRAKEIETMKAHLDSIANMYLTSLDINSTTEEQIREFYSKELESKDKIIIDLQANIKTLDSVTKENKELNKQIDKINKELDNKVIELNNTMEQLSTLNSIVAEYKEYKDTNSNLIEENKRLGNSIQMRDSSIVDLGNKLKVAENRITEVKEFYENAIKEFKIDSKENIDSIKVEHRRNVDELKAEIIKINTELKNKEKEILNLNISLNNSNSEKKMALEGWKNAEEEIELLKSVKKRNQAPKQQANKNKNRQNQIKK